MSELTLAYVGLVIMVCLFLALCWIFLFSYLFTEIIEKHLGRSKFVANNREGLSSLGLLGSVVRSCSIALMFLIPEFCEKRGLIEENELSNLPLHLKRKLLAPWITGGAFFLQFSFIGFLSFDFKALRSLSLRNHRG
ncbi:hypothetical protein [Pseudomonas fluorescens]|uniref:hypothetical protein n=1 Tax=Pseudomonas fluorescens TaxID=294 RepID=UPI001785B4E3|nr:hypothetical protein [Pseudomonas fluorescens]